MPFSRILTLSNARLRDVESAKDESLLLDKSHEGKPEGRFPLSQGEFAAALSIFLICCLGLFSVYLTMPAAEYEILKLPRSIADLQMLKEHLATYTREYTAQFILGFCATYIFMLTFMIPGTIFMSLLAGALFGVTKGIILVSFTATAGASSCYFVSKLFGRPIAFWLWPDKMRYFRAQVAMRRERLLNYMLFLRITPTLPNTFINLASPIVDVPYHIFFLATLFGLIPATYITVRAGLALGELRSVRDLYDIKTVGVLFLIGLVSIAPTLIKRKTHD
eukprot:TRINITY_DN18620_c0_g1_i1.p1 TRINITY_DN18620_c0_g1~~TRINITY_DN18620_c0_g1_i1.p1  ORF type:complete len:278 (+),score=16.83 TRINITY_DN18620_c0_g1_i1:838-1671(+)